jgi:hypothetical protein
MPRIFILFTLVSALGAGRLCAQAVPARSADYLFLATASDARATWVNPAGPATAPTASIAAELVFDRQETENHEEFPLVTSATKSRATRQIRPFGLARRCHSGAERSA